MTEWSTCTNIVNFAITLSPDDQQAFLIVYSVICWTIWKHRNEIFFNNKTKKSARNIILLIISLVSYWIESASKKLKDSTTLWLPDDLDAIPIQTLEPDDLPADNPMILYLPGPETFNRE